MNAIIHTWDLEGFNNFKSLLDQNVELSKIILVNGGEWEYSAVVAGEDRAVFSLLKIAKQKNLKLEIVVGSTLESTLLIDSKKYSNFQIHYWETYWLSNTYYTQTELREDQISSSNLDINVETTLEHIDFKIISLANRPHEHRCLMMDLLAKYNLIEDNAVSWHEESYSNENVGDLLTSVYRGYQYKFWQPKILKLQDYYSSTRNQDLLPKEYANSFCQLVMESTIHTSFITEKTCMPLFYMKPFIVASCKHFHKILKRMGFKLYDELFNYSFDSIHDVESRFEQIAINLEKINQMSVEELKSLNDSIYDKLLYNRNHAIMLSTKLSKQPKILHEIYEETKDRDTCFDQEFNNIFLNYK